MRKLALSGAVAALALGLAACGDYDRNEAAYNEANAAYDADGANYSAEGGNYAGTATAGAGWPAGTRIVVEEGVTYRIDPGGVRVALGPDDSRIVVEDSVRYRVDPGGTRVRIDERGAEIRIDDGDTAVNVSTNTP